MFSGYPTVQAGLASGKLHGLAVSSKNRLPSLPDVPSINEAGYEGFDAFNWVGCMVPAGTPSAIVAKLNEAIAKAGSSPDVQKRFSQTGVATATSSPAEFASFFREDLERWQGVVTKLGLKLDN
jgi:tripartite-type tricarboxylate transporter receptor subunit TctC